MSAIRRNGQQVATKTGTLGLYLRADQWGKSHGYWALMLSCIQRAVAEADLQLLIHAARVDCPNEAAFAQRAGCMVDGAIIVNSGHDPIAQYLVDTGLPTVEIGDAFSALPLVAVDGAQGIRLAVKHLWERGYTRPAFCWDSTHYLQNLRSREEAFFLAATEYFGLERGQAPSLEIAPSGLERFAGVWSLEPRPDCLICNSDELAFALIESALSRGIHVPNELGVTGFDCIPTFSPVRILTSVATPLEKMAREGIAKLEALIEGHPVDRSTVLSVTLRQGTSTRLKM